MHRHTPISGGLISRIRIVKVKEEAVDGVGGGDKVAYTRACLFAYFVGNGVAYTGLLGALHGNDEQHACGMEFDGL